MARDLEPWSYFFVKVSFKSQTIIGKFFRSLYVGKMTEYLFWAAMDADQYNKGGRGMGDAEAEKGWILRYSESAKTFCGVITGSVLRRHRHFSWQETPIANAICLKSLEERKLDRVKFERASSKSITNSTFVYWFYLLSIYLVR